MLFTVVIPLYNKEGQVALALESVLAQTFTDFEVVIVDDGSTDGSSAEAAAVIAAHPDRDMRLLRQPNGGVSAARNSGISAARGEYIAFLDADDEWKPGFLATIAGMIEKYPDCRVFATNYEFRDAQGRVTPTIMRHMRIEGDSGPLENYFQVATGSHPPLWTSAVTVKRNALDAIGGFPVGVASGEDLLTWARLACRHRIAFAKSPLAVFVVDTTLFNEDQSQRNVSITDYVGKELRKLHAEFRTPFLKNYIGLWYKMRTRIYLSKQHRFKALSEAIKSLRFDINLKIMVFVAMCILPYRTIDSLFKKFG